MRRLIPRLPFLPHLITALFVFLGVMLFATFHGSGVAPLRSATYSMVILTWLSLLGVIIVYGGLTPWYRSRTGIGFMSTKVSFFTIISLTIYSALVEPIPPWLSMFAWVFIIVTINYGITWNILYKQFFEHRADEMLDKTKTTQQDGVHDTGKETHHD